MIQSFSNIKTMMMTTTMMMMTMSH